MHANLAGTGLRRRHLPDPEHVPGGTRTLVMRGSHALLPVTVDGARTGVGDSLRRDEVFV